eukprot:CAMPEP_0115348240 /NCGR_PEP_ID=MMETSP0270-20121206/95307_1 /TAXON_ID=71861 /ORGANISM="Scrippsiella trochoidea, Strain CCMP3099" /LENGTH=174 /DNA_ID=CAMNT_0002770213 /DNA_START=141 /DNA_END=666 /DNA_ORIENTATION=+
MADYTAAGRTLGCRIGSKTGLLTRVSKARRYLLLSTRQCACWHRQGNQTSQLQNNNTPRSAENPATFEAEKIALRPDSSPTAMTGSGSSCMNLTSGAPFEGSGCGVCPSRQHVSGQCTADQLDEHHSCSGDAEHDVCDAQAEHACESFPTPGQPGCQSSHLWAALHMSHSIAMT